jgi:hypothetical protein
LRVEFADSAEDINTIINNSTSQQQWNQPQSPNQGKYQGNYNNSSNYKQPPLRELILEQAKINENISRKLAFNGKMLEEINAKLDDFSSAVKEQIKFNKKI